MTERRNAPDRLAVELNQMEYDSEARLVPVVYASGSYYEIGRQIGEEQRDKVVKMLASYRQMLASAEEEVGLDWDNAVLQSRKYAPFIEEFLPQYLDELRGIADGAEVDFEDLLVLNCIEALTSDALHLKCTSIAAAGEVTADGTVLVGHNEDWLPEDQELQFLIHATPEDEPPFLAMTYGGLLPNIGFNAAGIAQACDSVYPNDARLGVPRVFVSRKVLSAQTVSDAIRITLFRRRAAGYNHLIADSHGEIYNVEVSATAFDAVYAQEGYAVHCNNYLSPLMLEYEDHTEDLIGTRVRVNRARRLMMQGLGRLTIRDFKEILSDHVNYPNSICGHEDPSDPPKDRSRTICSLIMDLQELTMWYCYGPPCSGEYVPYRLKVH